MSTPKKTKGAEKAAETQPAALQKVEGATVNWENYQGEYTGFENVQESDLGIPFITILQQKSAEVDKTHKDYATKKIEGAEAGDLINTVTREILAKAEKGFITVVPAFYEKTYVEWKPNRGGLVKVHRTEAILNEVTGKTEKNESVLRNGNLLMETMSFYVILIQDSQKSPAVINMNSSALKAGRQWLNTMFNIKLGPQKVTPPMFSHHYILATAIERKDNNAWYGWNIQIGDMVKSQELANQAVSIGSRVKVLSAPSKALAASAAVSVAADEVPM